MQGETLVIYVLAIIVALVGLLGLFNTLSTSVIERRLEIAILRSMGATGRHVAVVFWIEGMALALIAWALGAILGIPGAYGLVNLIYLDVNEV
jgi:putative ABC transport system permease protein